MTLTGSKENMKIVTTIKKLYCGKTDNIKIQIFRSTQSSQFSYLLDLGFYLLMTNLLYISYPAARFFSYMAGTTISYILSIIWVFPSRNISNRFLEYGGFAVIGVVGAVENILLMIVFTNFFSLYHVYANIFAGIIVFFISFVSRKLLLFRKINKE